MLRYASRPIEDYFPAVELIADGPAPGAYIRIAISVFDHWLTEAEADANRIMCYSQACDLGTLDEYLDGERRMINFYGRVSQDSVLCNRPGPCRLVAADDPDLLNIFRSSLREERFMDVYFISGRVRVIGGYDRTDTAFVETKDDLELLKIHAHEAGVFIL